MLAPHDLSESHLVDHDDIGFSAFEIVFEDDIHLKVGGMIKSKYKKHFGVLGSNENYVIFHF